MQVKKLQIFVSSTYRDLQPERQAAVQAILSASHIPAGMELFAAGDEGGGGFGVRRPLRFLAFKLRLDEAQMEGLARILNELKTERAQAAVDDRRTVTGLADAIAGESFDEKRAEEAAALRLGSAERLKGAVVSALRQIHGLLRPDQRARFAYLIRTGTLSL